MINLNMLPAKQAIITTGTGKSPNDRYVNVCNLLVATQSKFGYTFIVSAPHSTFRYTFIPLLHISLCLGRSKYPLPHMEPMPLIQRCAQQERRTLRTHPTFCYTFNWLYWLRTIRVSSGRG